MAGQTVHYGGSCCLDTQKRRWSSTPLTSCCTWRFLLNQRGSSGSLLLLLTHDSSPSCGRLHSTGSACLCLQGAGRAGVRARVARCNAGVRLCCALHGRLAACDKRCCAAA